MKTTLLIMAAGIGSRFGTGIKQDVYKRQELAEAIETVKHTRYAAYESNTTTIVDSIEKYIKELV